ncbi:MAG: HIT family protein [Chlamydiota bacterium]
MIYQLFLCFFTSLSLFSCPFCPGSFAREAQTFYEDDLVLGVYPHKPIYPNHVLAIPKRHVERLEELTGEEMQAIFHLAKKIEEKIFQKNGLTHYLLLQKNGRSAGQTVPHAHFHMIPIAEGTWTISVLWRFFSELFYSPLREEALREKTALLAEQISD